MRFILVCISTFIILLANPLWVNGFGNSSDKEPMDTLYVRWQKEHTSLPFFLASVEKFSFNNEETISLESHGFGGVSLAGGDLVEIKNWIGAQKKKQSHSTIYIAGLRTPFELPFDVDQKWPSHLEVECISNDVWVYDLGLLHAGLLMEAGFTVVSPVAIPEHYSEDEVEKLKLYNMAFRDRGLLFYVSQENYSTKHWLEWEDILFYEDGSSGNAKSKSKKRKKFRKETGYEGFLVEAYNSTPNLSEKKNQFWQGVNMIRLGDNWIQQLSKEETDELSKNGDVKKAARFYFNKWRGVQSGGALDIQLPTYQELHSYIQDQSIVLVSDFGSTVPILDLESKEILTLGLDPSSEERIDRYKNSRPLHPMVLEFPMENLENILPSNALIIVDLSSLDEIQIEKLLRLNHNMDIIAIYQGEIGQLKEYPFRNLMYSADTGLDKQLTMIEMIFGVHFISGELPGYWADGRRVGQRRSVVGRISYRPDSPNSVDLHALTRIDSIANQAIKNQEIPGCQIMMVLGGRVVYDKSFGYLTYDSLTQVAWDHVYDVASVTKVVATVPAVMHEVETGRIDLEDHLGEQLSYFAGTDKSDLTVKNILMHESGLKSYYPFWRKAYFDKVNSEFLYKERVSRRRYKKIKINWEDSVNAWIARSEFNSLQKQDSSYGYLYSDIGFMLMKEMAERNSGTRLDTLVSKLIYQPMAMDHTFYNPRRKIAHESLVPTAQDRSLRKTQLVGEVHDKNAALLGGVSGHAGLFSNANDLAKFMQMMIQNGYYGGKQYFDSALVAKFTKKIDDNHRRALGWDKPSQSVSNASIYASDQAFGHSGFTGTLVWADPAHDLVYIFLSNRIYPDAQNYKLIENNTRTRIHDVMYESINSTYKFDNQDY